MQCLLRLASLAVFVLAFAVPAAAQAQSYPNKPVRIIVPFGAGGPGDTLGRLLAQHLSDQLKQPFVVETRPGAGAMIGSDAVAKSSADGYTLLMVSNAHTTNESLIANRPFQLMRDFVTVSAINSSDVVLTVHPAIEAKTLAEFISLAKSKPGQINYASSGIGTVYHMAGELLKTMSGIDIVHVPHKASGDMRSSVMGGHVQMMFDTTSTIAPIVRAGQVRALGTSGKQRSPLMPDVPTISEAGLAGYQTSIWFGLMAPANTPKEIVDKLNAEVGKVLALREVKELWAKQGIVPLDMSVAEFDKFLRDDIEKWARVVKATGMKVN